MEVADILASGDGRVVTTKPENSIPNVIETLTAERIGAVVVTSDEGTLAGIIAERDIVRGLYRDGAKLLEMTVGDLMTRSVVTCAPENSAEDIVKLMTSHSIRHIPVVRNQELLGVISILDLVRSRLKEVESDYGTLRTFMSTRIE